MEMTGVEAWGLYALTEKGWSCGEKGFRALVGEKSVWFLLGTVWRVMVKTVGLSLP